MYNLNEYMDYYGTFLIFEFTDIVGLDLSDHPVDFIPLDHPELCVKAR